MDRIVSLIVFGLFVLSGSSSAAAQAVHDVDDRTQLFIDKLTG